MNKLLLFFHVSYDVMTRTELEDEGSDDVSVRDLLRRKKEERAAELREWLASPAKASKRGGKRSRGRPTRARLRQVPAPTSEDASPFFLPGVRPERDSGSVTESTHHGDAHGGCSVDSGQTIALAPLEISSRITSADGEEKRSSSGFSPPLDPFFQALTLDEVVATEQRAIEESNRDIRAAVERGRRAAILHSAAAEYCNGDFEGELPQDSGSSDDERRDANKRSNRNDGSEPIAIVAMSPDIVAGQHQPMLFRPQPRKRRHQHACLHSHSSPMTTTTTTTTVGVGEGGLFKRCH